MKPDLTMLGKAVRLTVGEANPEGVFSARCEREAYLFGEKNPPKSLSAAVIGVFVRADGSNVLLCVPEPLAGSPICYECDLLHGLRPSEDVANGTLYPLYEKTSGAVIYTEHGGESRGERRYLLVKSESGHIGFPKGHIEYGETELENAAREIFEETGLPFSPHPDFRMEYTYTTLENTQKTGVFFLSRYDGDGRTPTFQREEVFADWLLPYGKAMELLNFPQDREILAAAEELFKKEEG